MPTPFMHLDYAERMRTHSKLNVHIRHKLEAKWPAFYLGNVAADYQVISEIPREQTHFYPLPPVPGQEAYLTMLQTYPQLADASRLPAAQAVFVAGYCFHLIQDLVWYWQVLIPYFIRAEHWPEDRRVRFLSHNALLSYLDRRAFQVLPAGAGEMLAAAEGHNWLPFIQDGDLRPWQELLVGQLRPGGTPETVAIYAGRMNMSAADFAARLDDVAWMNLHVFDKVPLAAVQEAMQAGIDRSVDFVNEYLR